MRRGLSCADLRGKGKCFRPREEQVPTHWNRNRLRALEEQKDQRGCKRMNKREGVKG